LVHLFFRKGAKINLEHILAVDQPSRGGTNSDEPHKKLGKLDWNQADVNLPTTRFAVVTDEVPVHVLDGVKVYRGDMERISGGLQLNDRALNAFLSLISDEETLILDTSISVHVANGNFAFMNRWFKNKSKRNLDKASRVLFPLHWKSPGHWALVLLDKRLSRIMLFDSLSQLRLFERMMEEIRSWAEQAKQEIKLNDEWPEAWYEDFSSEYSAQQTNGVDCGVFLLVNALLISQGRQSDANRLVSRREMSAWRSSISASISQGRLVSDLCEPLVHQDFPLR